MTEHLSVSATDARDEGHTKYLRESLDHVGERSTAFTSGNDINTAKGNHKPQEARPARSLTKRRPGDRWRSERSEEPRTTQVLPASSETETDPAPSSSEATT